MASEHRPRGDAVYAVLDAAPSIVVAVASDGRIDYANDVAVQSLGYTREELLGLPVEALVPPERAAKHVALREGFLADPHARAMGIGLDLAARRKDGTEFPVEISLTPVHNGDGPWVVATVRDITDRREAESRLQVLSRDYLTLAHLNQAVVRAPDELALFAETCRVAVEEGRYLGAFVGQPGPGGSIVSVASAGALDDYIAQLDLTLDRDSPRGNGPSARALRDGTPHYSADFLSDAETRPWQEAAERYGIRASANLPLRCGGRPCAVLTLYSAEPNIFDEQMRSLLEGLAENVSFALDGFAAAAQLEQVARQRTTLMQRLVVAQEEERSRIAADVHDDSVQALATADLRLGLLGRRIAEQAPELSPAVEQVQRTVADVAHGLRELLFELEPADARARMPELLEEAASHIFEHSDVRWELDASRMPPGTGHLLPPPVCGQALRIAKEAMINVRKHAHADRVTITVCPQSDGVEVAIADDGVGLDPGLAESAPGHRGLATMRDRASIVGGWCRLEARERGAVLRFWLPYDGTPGLTPTH